MVRLSLPLTEKNSENFTFPADKNLVSTFSIMFQLKEKLLLLVAVHCTGPILDISGIGAIFWGTFSEKRLHPLNRCYF